MSMGDSNDSADTFWPGYVDAISNLAINLLFVIAVMAIVVIGSTLQMSELMKRKDLAGEDGIAVSAEKTDQAKAGPGDSQVKTSKKSDEAGVNANKLREQAQTIQQQAEQIKQLRAQLASAAAVSQGESDSQGRPTTDKKVDVMTAQEPMKAPNGKNSADVVQGGLIVNFNKDVIELTKAETADLTEKIKRFGATDANSKWGITVVVPKGFSETKRLGFYRANIVRNLLLQMGVKGSNIDLKIIESARSDANSARVVMNQGR